MTTDIITKYRVEEHYIKATTYSLHGSYNTITQAKNKINKLITTGQVSRQNLFIIKQQTTITRQLIEY